MFRRISPRVSLAWALLLAGMVVAGCGSGPPASDTGQPTASAAGIDFTLDVLPHTVAGRAIPGAPVVLLVTASGDPSEGNVALTAEAHGATVTVEPADLPPGTVGEVTVVPDAVSAEVTLDVTILGSRGGIEHERTTSVPVAPGEDTIGPEAAALLARFTEWLAAERPDLGVGPDTEFEGDLGGWVLVVNHYQYVSEDWELGLDWHVMIAPDDWARIYLRHRWTESVPSAAFEISSVSGGATPHEIDPPESVWR
jgi:hypothetical protein